MVGLRVRTGCKTCKTRKIKCDERRPTCWRCDSTGRTCDGYEPVTDKRLGKRTVRKPPGGVVRVKEAATPWDLEWLFSLSAVERSWIDYFHHCTSSFASSAVDRRVWTELLPQLCQSESAIKHGVLAIAASHQRLQVEIRNSKTSPDYASYALEHYNLAIGNLRERLHKSDDAGQVALVCCLIFVCLECMHANRISVNTHLQQSKQMMATIGYNPRFAGVRQILNRLLTQSTMFGSRLTEASELPQAIEEYLSKPRPAEFSSISEAREDLADLADLAVHTIHLSRRLRYGRALRPWEKHYASKLGTALLTWRVSFKQTTERCRDHDASETPQTPNAESLVLLLRCDACFIWLQSCLRTDEMVYDEFTRELRDLLELANASLDARKLMNAVARGRSGGSDEEQSCFTLEQNIAPALYLIAIKCRHPHLRRNAIRLLQGLTIREWLWDARVHASVAKRIVEIEEGRPFGIAEDRDARLWTSDQMLELVPEHKRIWNARIDVVHQDPSGSRAIVAFHTRPDGFRGRDHRWSEMIYA